MKGLKIAAIAAVSLLIVLVLLTVYLFYVAEVNIISIDAYGEPASNDESYFNTIKSSIDDGTFVGTLYQKPDPWKGADEYILLKYELKLHNGCLVPIDMVELQVVPMPGDILQLGSMKVRSLNARTDGSFEAAALMSKDSHPVREIIVTYYVWGVSFNIKATYGK